MTAVNELPTVQFKKHKTAYTIAAIVALVLSVTYYFTYRSENYVIAWVLLSIGLLFSVYCVRNAFSDAVILEFNSDGIKYKQYYYSWDRLHSYTIRKEDDGESSFTCLVLNLKNSKVPLEIQMDWIDDEESVKHHMAIFAKCHQIHFYE
jgi:hypothetical protein